MMQERRSSVSAMHNNRQHNLISTDNNEDKPLQASISKKDVKITNHA
jgi:hypothetical protein